MRYFAGWLSVSGRRMHQRALCRGAGPITLKAHDFRVRRFGGGVEIIHAAELDSTIK